VPSSWRAAVFILLAAALPACTGGDEDSASDERMLELEAYKNGGTSRRERR
jgi:hypothetical protein